MFEKHSNTKRYLLTLLFSSLVFLVIGQCPIQTQCGSLAVSGGFPEGSSTFFCEGEVVQIENFTDPSQIDTTIVDWGDGAVETFTTELFYSHIYDFPADTCLMNQSALNMQITTTVINNCAEGQSVNCFITFVQIKVDPVAVFGANSQYCLGEPIEFDNNSCENGDTISYFWDFDGLDTSTEENPTYTFPAAGQYTVTLTTTNECGDDTFTQIITIIDPPTAEAVVVDGVANEEEPYIVCLADGGLVCLDGDSLSLNETSYLWEVQENSGFSWLLPDDLDVPILPDMKILFFEPGPYSIVLETNNACDQPAYDTLFFEVIASDFELNPQEDGCVSLDYTPEPLEEEAVYTINGNVVSDFPITLVPDTYIVEVTGASNICTSEVLADTFVVLTEAVAQILTPDTTVCSLDGEFSFAATPDNGEWRIDGELFDGNIQAENFDAGTYEITYGNEPCITSDMINFTIVTASIDLPDDTEVCIDEPPVTFTAMPDGGEWSGQGIDENGIFTPTETGEFTIYYEVMNTALPSCSNIDSFQVTVSELMIDFVVDTCENTNLCFELVNTSDFTTITWDFDGTGTSSQSAPCHTFPAAEEYQVTATITRGACTQSITKSVSIEAPPVANFNLSHEADLCSSLMITFENNSTGSNLIYEWRRNGEIFSNLAIPEPIFLDAITQDTLFDISLTVRNDCSADTQTETLLVKPKALSIFGTDQNQYCSGDTTLISNISLGNPDTFEWFLDGNLVSTDSVPPVIAHLTDVVDTLELCLITTNTCGSDTLCQLVEVIPTNVEAFFNTSPTTVCVGDTVWFSNFATLGVPVFYTFGDGNSTSNPNPFYIYTEPGDYLVTQQAFGCGFDVFEQMIQVVESPVSTWDNPAFGCPASDLLFESTSFNVMRYEWDFGDSTAISELATPTHAFAEAGSYEVCLTVFSNNDSNCSHTTCQTVEIFTPPTAGFIVTDSLCLGDIMNFTSTASDGAESCNYLLGDGNSMALCDFFYQYESAGLFVVTQIVEDANFCTDTINQQVLVRPVPTPDFGFQAMGNCHLDSIAFENLSQNADSYFWNFGDDSTSVLTHPRHFYENPGTYEVTLEATIDGICTAVISKNITIEESPQAVFSAAVSSACAGLAIAFENNSIGIFTETIWDFGDGLFSFENAPSHIFEMPGMYQVQLVVNNNEQCPDTTTVDIIVHDSLVATTTTQHILCNGATTGSIDLNITSGNAPFSFSWSHGVATEDTDNLGAGIYEITATDNNACTWIDTIEIIEPSAIELTVDENVVTCFGGSDGSLSIDVSGGVEPYQILWEGGETTSTLSNLMADNYNISITDANNCQVLQTITLGENPPIEYLDSIQHISCFGVNDGVLAFPVINGGFPPFEVTLMSDTFEAGGVSVTRFDALLPDVYTVQIEDANNCIELFETEILEPAPVSVDIKEDSVFLDLGQSVELTTLFNANNPTFSWSPPKYLDCTDCPNPTAQPEISEIYTVTMTDENGCIDEDEVAVFINVNRNLFVPNVFTPNGDLRNDVFLIRSEFEESIENIQSFQIYNRWGEKVFEAIDFLPNDRQYGWDGLYLNKKAEPGVYAYAIEVTYTDGETKVWSGEVLLMR